MPNYSNQEAKVLDAAQLALSEQARQPALGTLSATGLHKLLSDLASALAAAGPRGTAGRKTAGDFLNAALRRANDERRKRNREPVAGKAAQAAKPATAAKQPAKPAAAKTRNARAGAAARKPDARTAPRRATKAQARKADAPTAAQTSGEKPPQAPVSEASLAELRSALKAAQAEAKAARKAQKEAEKAARKAQKEAAKAARKAEKKVERQAAQAAKKSKKPKKSGKSKG